MTLVKSKAELIHYGVLCTSSKGCETHVVLSSINVVFFAFEHDPWNDWDWLDFTLAYSAKWVNLCQTVAWLYGTTKPLLTNTN